MPCLVVITPHIHGIGMKSVQESRNHQSWIIYNIFNPLPLIDISDADYGIPHGVDGRMYCFGCGCKRNDINMIKLVSFALR
jgi:hypothetical protein